MYNCRLKMSLFYICVPLLMLISASVGNRAWLTTDELENYISPEDLQEFLKLNDQTTASTTLDNKFGQSTTEESSLGPEVPSEVDCFGLGSFARQIRWMFNLKPGSSDQVNVQFFFSSRKQPSRVQVVPGDQFGLEWVDFNVSRRTVIIIHGFMSHSNASWVNGMKTAMLQRDDVNVIAVDWSRGGNTWKYWRAVANTRRVGSDVTGFFRQLIQESGANIKDFHCIGHSLGAHICSYLSFHLGKISRITGLDPAQPCFRTSDTSERLDETDADFVDVIHTNGRLLARLGFGLPELAGDADFYPNGGMKQPGCQNDTDSVFLKLLPALQQAICSHGRSYLLFTESLRQTNCTFRAHRWNLTYEGVNASLVAACDRLSSCSEMGIHAAGADTRPRARGAYFVLTTDKEPYCPTEWERSHHRSDLLQDLRRGFQLDRSERATTTHIPDYADPMPKNEPAVMTTTEKSKSIWERWFG